VAAHLYQQEMGGTIATGSGESWSSQLGAKGVDPDGGATSGLDVCKLAAIDHSQLYLIALQVDPYTAVLDDGQEFAVENDHMEIMVYPKTATLDQILEQLKQRCPWGPNQ
jgi:hypothetical protein